MAIYSHTTALQLLRLARGAVPVNGADRFDGLIESRISVVDAAQVLNASVDMLQVDHVKSLLCEGEPLHLLTTKEHRSSRAGLVCHETGIDRLSGGCFSLGGGVHYSAPEELIVQLAQDATLVALLKCGYELCGCYSIPAHRGKGEKLTKVAPVTSPEEIARYLGMLGKAKGKRGAYRALKYILPNSASPMETALVIILILPPRLGGYGLPLPCLNEKVTLSKPGPGNQPRTYYLDVFWPEHAMALEYDSDDYHFKDVERAYYDSDRRAILKAHGIETLSVTKGQAYSLEMLDRVAATLAKPMGRRLQLNREGYREKRLELHAQLFPSAYRSR